MNENESQDAENTELSRQYAAVRREKPDMEPGKEPAPLWVSMAAMVAMLFGGGYAGAYVGGFEFDKTNPYDGRAVDVRPIADGATEVKDPFQDAMKKGASVYNNCQGCHQATGTGQPGVIPPLAGSEWVTGGTERIVRVLIHGLSGPVTVKGVNYTNVMPPQGHLSDKELSYVMTYIRNSFGNKASMVTPEMVKTARESVKAHVGPWTAPALEEFKDKDIPGELPAAPTPAAAAAPAK